jgi:hypothetical protein
MLRVIVGLIKGAVVGAGVGYGALRLGWQAGMLAYLACALVGALVGVVAGRPPWRSETSWTPIVKMVVGAIVGAGLCALALHFLPNPTIDVAQLGPLELHSASLLAPLVGVLYGIFVEVDDGGERKAPAAKKG